MLLKKKTGKNGKIVYYNTNVDSSIVLVWVYFKLNTFIELKSLRSKFIKQ